jgi:hypothetical protein
MNSQPVLIRKTKSIMKGGKVLSLEVLYERPKVEVAITPPPSIKKPESPPTPTSPTSKQRPEFMEPLPTSPSSDVHRKVFYEEMQKREQEYYEWEAHQPSTYRREIELLERLREKYNKKASWSAKDAAEVDRIDKEIAANLKMIDWLEDDLYSDEESE